MLTLFTEKQKCLISEVRAAMNCAGQCSLYCYGCNSERKNNVKRAYMLMVEDKISFDILSAAAREGGKEYGRCNMESIRSKALYECSRKVFVSYY